MTLSDRDLASWRRREAVAAGRGLASSGERSLRLVVIENSPDYAALVEQMLVESFGAEIELVRGDTLASAVSALAEQSLPRSTQYCLTSRCRTRPGWKLSALFSGQRPKPRCSC